MTDLNFPDSPILRGPGVAIRAARGPQLRARNWRAEALLRMFENVLEVGENPDELVVYASLGKAARDWEQARAIASALLRLDENQTLILQSGAAIGILDSVPGSPVVLSAVNNTVGRWSTSERFYERAAAGETIWGGLTAAAWQYIGRQGVLGGTYELLRVIADRHFGGPDGLRGRWMLTSGMGGMGSAQPLSAAMLGLSSITVEIDPLKIDRLHRIGGLDVVTDDLDTALAEMAQLSSDGPTRSVGLLGNAADVFPAVRDRGVTPDIVTDQTAAHDARFGYVPSGYGLDSLAEARRTDPDRVERDARASMAAEVEAMITFAAQGAVAFENGNNLRVQAIEHLGRDSSERVAAIRGFMEAYLRPLFARGIGPFRWVALSGDEADLAVLDDLAATMFPERPEVAEWIERARTTIATQGLTARTCWLGHGERSAFAVRVNELVADGSLTAPVLFSRDHLDSAGMTHPRIGTEGMLDGSDGVSDWPLLDALLLAASGADLVAIHSGGGGYSGWMQSAGVSIVADGDPPTTQRLRRVLDSDSGLGVLRHATAGYEESYGSIASGGETGTAPFIWFNDSKGHQHA